MADEEERGGIDRAAVGRLIAFTDAVFAVAMVLLVVPIGVPDPNVPAGELHDLLGDATPQMFAFGLSFAALGLLWSDTHRAFDHLAGRDDRLLYMLVAFWLCVAFVPYPAAVLGNHLDAPVAVVFYAASLAIAFLAWSGLSWQAARRGLLDSSASQGERRLVVFRGLATAAVLVITLPLSGITFDIGGSGVSAATIAWVVAVPPARHAIRRAVRT